MSLLVDAATLVARRDVALGALAPLAASLRAELEPVLAGAWHVPAEKALLSRAGGRCPRDGSWLAFDPYDSRHRCPRCGNEVTGELHDRFRPYWYQLWLAERAVHAALLGVLLDDARCRATAASILHAYADRYLAYPDRDNVLGPSRPFFSTYLESIWLLQLAIALDLLETAGVAREHATLGGRVRDRILAPSAALVTSYDEGLSNRQVWNDAAAIAAGILLADDAMIDRALQGSSGLAALLDHALLADGSWYEGENYHLFAHRGLWYAVTMAERLGRAPAASLVARFDEGFAAPFRTLLPDLSYPSRRDSQYAVSVRQPRFAESCELGLARGDDPRLAGMLARLYDPAIPLGDTGRRASTADVERNLPATGLRRADLSWRALLCARETLPSLLPAPLTSDLLPAQGIGILRRRGGELFVALDYGHSGGGHGHPDRLDLLLSVGDVRWFDDPGTGSYVDESLHWYRSTLAHTAPLLDGRSQPRVDGRLLAFEDRADFGWISASAPLANGCELRRSIVVAADYLIDRLDWRGDAPHDVALPLHGVLAVLDDGSEAPRHVAPIAGGTGREDGFAFLRDTARLDLPGEALVRARSRHASGATLRGWIVPPSGATFWSAVAPGPPGREPQPLLLVRGTASAGTFVGVWCWTERVASVEVERGVVTVRLAGDDVHVHRRLDDEWLVAIEGPASAVVRLRGIAESPAKEIRPEPIVDRPAASTAPPSRALPARFELGEAHYRGAEESWRDAGEPTASVELDQHGHSIAVTVRVPRAECRFVSLDAENPYANDPAAIHGDGVQLYACAGGRCGGWLIVPVPDAHDAGVRVAEGWADELPLRASWTNVGSGYELRVGIDLPEESASLELDVLVNLAGPERVRRRGQLVLSGARGERVYLRADRHERDRLLPFALAAASRDPSGNATPS